MAKFAQRSVVFYFFVCFFLLTALIPVFGRGSQEPDLSKADELIAAKEYDEAILLLSEYIRQNPDKFELANQRLRKIYQIRDEFNRYSDELINMLTNNPDDSERVLALTLRLRALENENSPLMTNFVSRAQEIAQFNVYRNQLRDILQNGRIALDRGDSEGAILIYASGMSIMRDEFFAAGYGTRIERDVQQETQRINTTITSFRPDNAQIVSITSDLVRAINSGQTARITELINRLNPIIDDFTKQKQELYRAVNSIDRMLEELRRSDPGMGDRNHLAFISRVIHGRTDESIQEGMFGAFDSSWRNSIGSVINVISSNIESIYSSNLASFKSGAYASVSSSLASNENYISLSPLFYEKHRQFQASGNPRTVSLFGNQILYEDLPSYIKIISMVEAGNTLLQASNIAGRLVIDRSSFTSWQEGRITLDDALRREQQTRANIAAIQSEFETIKNRAIQTDRDMSVYHNVPYIQDAITAIDNVSSAIITEDRMSAQRFYSIESGYLERELALRREQLEKGRNFLNGQSHTAADGSVTIYRYPAEALTEFTSMLSGLTADIERGNSVLTQLRNEPQTIASNSEITSIRDRYQTTYNALNSIRTEGTALAETARSRSALAETNRQEGERLFREAQTAYQRQDYETARNNIQRASERFNSSLEIQESTSLRETWDTQLVNLGRAIAVAENERIIVEVRNLVNTARTAYFAGNFVQAENSLIRARDRWLITNTEENEEVLYWLGMVRGGTSARSSRTIPATAPLFPEMSQLLSQARRNYEEGMRYINAGQRSQGIAKFDEARLQTREVRLMFPVNQEAGILELRMEQFTDPTAFNASFEQRLRAAINGTRQRSLDSYADLQNLAEINSNYPGIRGILTQAEIDMGFRPPPPNPANIARSRELTASATRILEGNQTAQFEVALAQINEAITLNPDNSDAARVKDRLLSRMSVPGAIVLSSEDEEQYQRAVRELQAGNNLVALALVDRLLQNPRNRNITKLIELQRRIQSVL
jgi:hypothetical protein